jgi:hypothetical protein
MKDAEITNLVRRIHQELRKFSGCLGASKKDGNAPAARTMITIWMASP